MTETDIEWLVSLSLISLLGPKGDVDFLKTSGFYKKTEGMKPELAQTYEGDADMIQHFLEALRIVDRDSYLAKLKELLEGSGFSANAKKLLQLGRTLGVVERELPKSYMINGHPYMYDFLEVVMQYEFHWPKEGLRPLDVANYVMLLRVGRGRAWLMGTAYKEALEAVLPLAKEVFDNYESFGKDSALGRQIYCDYLRLVGESSPMIHQKDVLRVAYYSVWQYMVGGEGESE